MNPFEGVTPSLDIFGAEVNSLVALVLGGLWALAFVGCAIGALIGTGKWAVARHSNRSEEMTEAAGQLKVALIAFGACAALGIIFAAILFIVGTVQGGE
ncbi:MULTISPECIES: hypothetical protein [Brachybacterium]|uniref:hypothetical protein n=1 Tax=Brachybacterium TaxID=43668 RepID=UPI000B3BBACD|nr:hypothetical protein [Brachybacterium massiliense]